MLKVVYESANNMDAYLIHGLLAQQGVQAFIAGEYLQGGVGELPAGMGARVQVQEADYQQARAIVMEWQASAVLDESGEAVELGELAELDPSRQVTAQDACELSLSPPQSGRRRYWQIVLGIVLGLAVVIVFLNMPV